MSTHPHFDWQHVDAGYISQSRAFYVLAIVNRFGAYFKF